MKEKKEVKQTVKQYCLDIDEKSYNEITLIACRHSKVRNYVYGRYGSIKGLFYLKNHRKKIRDGWVKNGFAKNWSIPSRHWKIALDSAIGNIKSQWSNCKNKIKKAVYNNSNLEKDEKFYIYYILKSDLLLYSILTGKDFKKPKKLKAIKIKESYVHNLIKRYVRKHKGKKPHSRKARSFELDESMYRYEKEEERNFLYIQGLKKGERIKLPLTDDRQFKGTLRIVIKSKERIEIHHCVTAKIKKISEEENTMGIDKGYNCLIATSKGTFYGSELNNFLSEETERLNEKNRKRNKLRSLLKKNIEKGNTAKAGRICKYNLGNRKYVRKKEKVRYRLESYINREIGRFITEEKPSEVVMENLNFTNWREKLPKKIKRRLSRWVKGYIRERLEYKFSLKDIRSAVVNPAYTSQICSKCGCFGLRTYDRFYCPYCDRVVHADYNAGKNVLARRDDKEITLYTPYKKVKEILLARCSTVVGSPYGMTGSTRTPDTVISQSESELQKNLSIDLHSLSKGLNRFS
ncbi:MAG: transposase [Candidatus Eremiobacterota bacterium]